MGKRRRHELDIYADILKTALKGARKTHIVGRANLNFKLITRYLPTLIDQGLMAQTREPFKSRYMYWTTPKGEEFLDNYYSLLQAINSKD